MQLTSETPCRNVKHSNQCHSITIITMPCSYAELYNVDALLNVVPSDDPFYF